MELPDGVPYRREEIVPAHGTVKDGGCPCCLDIDLVYPLWLAYCASTLLSPPGEGLLVAPLFATGGPGSLRFDLPARWELSPGGFARKIEWFSEGRSPDWQPDGTIRLEEYPPPFNQRFLQAAYEVTDWTGFGRTDLPARFVLKVFGPHYSNGGETAASLDLCYSITGTLEKLRAPARVVCPPKLTTKTHVMDWRLLLDGKPICYGSDSTWMNVEEIKAKLRRIELGLEPAPNTCRRTRNP